ncbi:MAG: DUF1987 domain-containing protein [bacterium]
MESYKISGTDDTPEIVLNADTEVFSFSGRSLPEDAVGFYRPVFSWLEKYFENPKPLSRFIFKLTYFNTASSKVIQDILLRLNEYAESGHNIELDWYYDKDDEDILESGEEFRDAVDFPMNLHRLDY